MFSVNRTQKCLPHKPKPNKNKNLKRTRLKQCSNDRHLILASFQLNVYNPIHVYQKTKVSNDENSRVQI